MKSYPSDAESSPLRGFKLNLKEVNATTFDLEQYDKLSSFESFPIEKEVMQQLPSAVVKFIGTHGWFKFGLTTYPGKNNPFQTIKNDTDNIIYHGQVTREKDGRIVRDGKGYLLQENSSLYCGYFQKDSFQGPGLFVNFQGCISYYRGFWIDGSLQGKGMLFTENGYRYIGDWVDSAQDGYGQEYWSDNSTYKGDFKRGYKWGHGDFVWKKEGQRYIGQFKEGEIEGFGTFEWINGDKYEGRWTANLMDGKGKFTWADGTVYEGEYVAGKKEGFGSLTNAQGFVWEGYWKNGMREGKGHYVTKNGERVLSYWSDDKQFAK